MQDLILVARNDLRLAAEAAFRAALTLDVATRALDLLADSELYLAERSLNNPFSPESSLRIDRAIARKEEGLCA
jgi:hypothetical protein